MNAAALAQPMGGVLRHAREVFWRAAQILEQGGGELVWLDGMRPAAVDLHGLGQRRQAAIPARGWLARASTESAQLALALEQAHRAGAPIQLVHTGHLPLPVGLAVPSVLLLHDLKSLSAGTARRALGRTALASAAREARRIVVVSQALGRELAEAVEIDPKRILAVPHGCDHLELLERNVSQASPILCVAHLEARKNLGLLLEALAADASLPDLEIAGAARGNQRAELERSASKLKVTLRVRFLGEQNDAGLAGLYSRARALVLPSLREGFGLPILEAQRAGVPVAHARSPVLAEVAGPDAEEFDPHDAKDCARALVRACHMTPRRIKAARARAQTFTWQRSANGLVDAWLGAREIVEGPAGWTSG